ncbi:MAG TPA: Gfo/Idh/MocA family oxidoreductase [Syntrophorhabdales bacterium]|nr:Gfo/Idh/MocA family oxidoreductase [Syntrophorhabdales bacterium]
MPLKICVIGVGHMGRIHAEKLKEMEGVVLCGLIDADHNCLEEASRKHSAPCFSDYKKVLPLIDAALIATPTRTHYAIARDCLEKGVHVFMEKPITTTPAEAEELIATARAKKLVLQVGHLERFSPAFLKALRHIKDPIFIEAQRISTFTGRSTDIDVVMDLMIHDIDLVLSIARGEVIDVRAQGTPVVTDKIDVANARIEFEGGCVASLTASRASKKKERSFKIFQKERYFDLDLLKGRMTALARGSKGTVRLEEYQAEKIDPVKAELMEFIEAVKERRQPRVEGEHGLRALLLANLIRESIKQNLANRRAGKVL